MIKAINTVKDNPEILKTPAVECPVTFEANGNKIWHPDVIEWATNLLDTANEHTKDALGLACNQIWDVPDKPPFKMFAINTFKKDSPWVIMLNPELILSGKPVDMYESCLSNPKKIKVRRKQNVLLRFNKLDEPMLRREEKVYYTVNQLAIVIQHEYDHLLGKINV